MPVFADDLTYPFRFVEEFDRERTEEECEEIGLAWPPPFWTDPDARRDDYTCQGERVLLTAVLREPPEEWLVEEQIRYQGLLVQAGIDIKQDMRPGEQLRDAARRLMMSMEGDEKEAALRGLFALNNERIQACIVEWDDADVVITSENCGRLPARVRRELMRAIQEIEGGTDEVGESKAPTTTSSAAVPQGAD